MNTNKFTRADIAAVITKTGIDRIKAAGIAMAIVQAMVNALTIGETVELRGFGSLEVRERKAYKARNPKTGEAVIAPAQRRILFRPGQELKAALKNVPEGGINNA
jgi:nucleoid DNA-binding protein